MFNLSSDGIKNIIEKEKELGNEIDVSYLINSLSDLQEKVMMLARVIYHSDGHDHMEHGRKVGMIAKVTAERLGCSKGESEVISLAAVLHDVGKIKIRPKILNKPGKLTDIEYEEVKEHVAHGEGLIEDYFKSIARMVANHHERHDGKGYPKGLKGKDIPLASRIISVSDCFDAMTTQRSYNTPKGKEEAIKELKKNAGTQFDPKVVDAFVGVLKEMT